MLNNTTRSYGSVARTFHWLTALLIFANIGLGLAANRAPLEQMALKVQLFSLHKTLGIAALVVALLRITWAVTQPRPAPVHPERRAETLAAETVHWLLYASLVLVPVTGWIEHAATEGYAPILWPLGQGLPLVPKSPTLALTMAAVHHLFAWLLMAAVALHVAGAVKHAVLDRDGVLGRMVAGRPAGRGGQGGHVLPALLAAVIFASGTGFAVATQQPAARAAATAEAGPSEWQVIEGALGFTVRQMGAEVAGSFSDWAAAINFDPERGTGQVRVSINMESVSIGTVTEQARGAAFFDVAGHPVAVFEGAIRPEGEGYVAEGPLALKGQEAAVTLPFSLQLDGDTAVMQGSASLDRRDWQVGTGYDDEATVGFPVEISVNLTATR